MRACHPIACGLRGGLLGAMLGLGLPLAQAEPGQPCQSSPQCERHLTQAASAFAAKQYDSALASYQAAYAVVPAPPLLLAIGRCHQLLGHSEQAQLTYRRLSALTPPADPETQQQLGRYTAEAALVSSSSPARSSPERSLDSPVWKSWWLWTATGVALTGVVSGLAIGLSPKPHPDVAWIP